MKPWITVSRRKALDYSPYLTVEVHTVRLPNGRLIEDWTWVETPDYVNVVAVTSLGDFVCLRQRKYAVEGVSLAAVGGYIEPGEEPRAAARRELREETGYEASDWIELGKYVVDSNRGAGTAHFFLALDARRVCEPAERDQEEPEVVALSRAALEEALSAGEFKGLAWAAVVALALRALDRRER
jgi:ADP-ribose pyrophosphatase